MGFYILGRGRGQHDMIEYFRSRGLLEFETVTPTADKPKDDITVEKINDVFYAYFGETFIGQGSSLEELADSIMYSRKMKILPNQVSFRPNDHLTGLQIKELIELLHNRQT